MPTFYKFDRPQTRDAHNIILLPRRLNTHRSNYRLVESIGGGGFAKDTSARLFVPPREFRGRYARAIGYVYLQYPEYRDCLEHDVLSLPLTWKWILEHRPEEQDIEASYRVADKQGNTNPLLTHQPDDALHKLHEFMKNRQTQT